MEKIAKKRYGLKEKEVRAFNKTIRTSPRKLNLVGEMIRGLKVDQALSALNFSKRRIAKDVKTTLMSAIANAENNHRLDIDRLFVKEAYVGKGIVMKRIHPRARGKAAAILKPFSNLTIILQERA